MCHFGGSDTIVSLISGTVEKQPVGSLPKLKQLLDVGELFMLQAGGIPSSLVLQIKGAERGQQPGLLPSPRAWRG